MNYSNTIAKKCGTITVSVFKDENTNCNLFTIQSDNVDILPVSDIIEDTLKLY